MIIVNLIVWQVNSYKLVTSRRLISNLLFFSCSSTATMISG